MNKEKLALWKQMRALEIISAVLAECLMQQGTVFCIDPEQITWPDKTVTSALTRNEIRKLKKQGKVSAKTKHGLWGDLVHRYSDGKDGNDPPAQNAPRANVELPTAVPKKGRPKAKKVTKGAVPKNTKKQKVQTVESDGSSDDGDENSVSTDKTKVDVSKCIILLGSFCVCMYQFLKRPNQICSHKNSF